jgi:hypothetical protein
MRVKQRTLALDVEPQPTSADASDVNHVRRPKRRRSGVLLARRAAPDGARHKLTLKEKRFITAVCRLWSRHHGWGERWPVDRRYDVILIGQWVRKLGAPMHFWRRVIRSVPVGARFLWLTAQPTPFRVGRLEELWRNEQEQRYAVRKKREAIARDE